jgi:hypothetical protein
MVSFSPYGQDEMLRKVIGGVSAHPVGFFFECLCDRLRETGLSFCIKFRKFEGVVRFIDPDLESVVHLFSFLPRMSVKGEISLLVGVFIEVEEHEGLAF